MEPNKRPLKRLPQVTLWELQRHTITVKNPLAWDKTGSDKPIQRDIVDLSELCLHRAGEGSTPLFDRGDILVNQDGMETRTMRIKRTGRSRSSSSSSSSDSSRSRRSSSRTKWKTEAKINIPKPLRFTCERKRSPVNQKDDSHRLRRNSDRKSVSPRRRPSISPHRRMTKRKSSNSPSKSPYRGDKRISRAERSPVRRNRSPLRGGKSPERAGTSHMKDEKSRRSEKSPLRSRDRRRSRSRSRLRRNTPPGRSRSPRRTSSTRHRETGTWNRSPNRQRRDYSPHKSGEHIPPIDYEHLAHVITQMYPKQPFFTPPIVHPPMAEFYPPPYGIPPGPQLPPRPRFPPRPPIIYNNRTIKIFRPNETTSTSNTTTTTVTTTTPITNTRQNPGSSTVTSNEPDSEVRNDVDK